MTAIHPVNATVVAKVEPPFSRFYLRGKSGNSGTLSLSADTIEEANEKAQRYAGHGWLVQIIDTRPDPLPSPASAEIDQLLVDLYNKITFMDGDPVERNAVLRSFDALSERLRRVTR